VSARFHIGGLIFPRVDQTDFTGPFEVLSRLPDAVFHVVGKGRTPVRDAKDLILTPEETLTEAPQLDVLLVPGGAGVNALLEDDEVLGFVRSQAAGARYVLSVCTGALVCGAAGLLRGRRATTHWASFHLLQLFGAIPVQERVVADGNLVTTAGVTAGFDGALRVAALLCGDRVAQEIQLSLEYAPEPPFTSGSPETAPADVLKAARESLQPVVDERLAIIRRIAARHGGAV
jgi:cyclohexyl-isocyanide hydratase